MSLFGGPLPTSTNSPEQQPNASPDTEAQEWERLHPSSLPSTIHQSPIAEDEESNYDDSDVDEDQPNGFRRPKSRQRFNIKHERSLAASLDRLEDVDLAIHLYNTHALKRRLYVETKNGHASSAFAEQWQRKERWIRPREEGGEESWYPNRLWTVWPLPPDVVPRPDERLARSWRRDEGTDGWTVRKKDDGRWRPSLVLEEVLAAEMTRAARERFDGRAAEASNALRNTTHEDTGNEDMVSTNNSRNRDLEATSQSDARARKRRARSTSWTDPADEPMRPRNLRPVIMADDEQAKQILQSTIRHILQKLDDLLEALHQSRQNHIDRDDVSTTTASSNRTSRETSAAIDTSAENPRKRIKGQTGGRYGAGRMRSRSRQQKRSEHYMKRLLNELRPRDWSEVVGMAAMTEWDGDVVKRTAARCENLFGEQMDLEDRDEDVSTFEIDERLSRKSEKEHDESLVDEMVAGVHVDGFMQPIRLPRKRIRIEREGSATRSGTHDGGLIALSSGNDEST